MEQDDRQNGDGAEPVDVAPVTAVQLLEDATPPSLCGISGTIEGAGL
jgi:hypothetical protein